MFTEKQFPSHPTVRNYRYRGSIIVNIGAKAIIFESFP